MRLALPTLVALLATVSAAHAQPSGPGVPAPIGPPLYRPLSLLKVTPAQVEAGKAQTATFTYRQLVPLRAGLAPQLQLAVTWEILGGSTTLETRTLVAPLASSGLLSSLVGRVPLDLGAHKNATHVAWRAQAFTVALGANGTSLVTVSDVDSGKIPAAGVAFAADVVQVAATETAGGFGTPPPHPLPAPPPGLHFQVTLKNRTASAILASDPTVGLEIRYAEVTATGTGPFTTLTDRLSTTVPASGQAVATASATLPRIYARVAVVSVLVRRDPATGKTIADLSPRGAPVVLTPPIFFPPAPPPTPNP